MLLRLTTGARTLELQRLAVSSSRTEPTILPVVSQRSIYRQADKLFLKSRLFKHLITDHEAHINNSVYTAPSWWEAVNDFPMFSLYRKRINWKEEVTPDTPLIREILRRHPELADEPHALAPGLERYYVHPVRKLVERWKTLMGEGLSKDAALAQMELEQWRERVADKIENDVQVHQASLFGAPAPDIAAQLTAIDRDMKQAMHAGVVHLKMTRFERLRQIAEKKLELIETSTAAKRKAAGEFTSRFAYLTKGEVPRELLEELAEVAKDSTLPSHDMEEMEAGKDSISVSGGLQGEVKRREKLRAIREEEMKKLNLLEKDSPPSTEMDDEGYDALVENAEQPEGPGADASGELIHDGQLATGTPDDMTNDFPFLLEDARKLTHNDVRVVMTDAQFVEFKCHFPELKEAFEEVLWETDTFFSEKLQELMEIDQKELAHPSAARLKVKQDMHHTELAKLGPFLGRDPTGEFIHPEVSSDVRSVDEVMDMLKLLKSGPEIMRESRPPEPEDLINFNAKDLPDQTKNTTRSIPVEAYKDGLFDNFYEETFDQARSASKPAVYDERNPDDIEAELNDSRERLLGQLSALREHLVHSSRFANFDDTSNDGVVNDTDDDNDGTA